MKFTCIIPVRFASTRFPGKPLAKINGKTMLSIVWENANKAKMLDQVIVAAYDQEIEDYCKKEGMKYVRTSPSIKNGSEAVSDVAKGIDAPYIFELQGDQPLVGPDVIDKFLSQGEKYILKNPEIDVVQAFAEASAEETSSEDIVKVAISHTERMILCTRAPIKSGYRTLGLYIWKRDSLLKFPNLEVSDLEKSESCHPIRFFMNDFYVQGVKLDAKDWVEVDREHHIKEVERVMKNGD